MATNIDRLIDVQDIARRVTTDAIDKMRMLEADSDEDYSDAVDAVGILFQYVGMQMMHDVYKDDPNALVRLQMEVNLSRAKAKAQEALATLKMFDIHPTFIEEI